MKLNKQKADDIRYKVTHTHSPKQLAGLYGVSERLIYKVLNNEIWKDSDYVPDWKVSAAKTASKTPSTSAEEACKSSSNPESVPNCTEQLE